MMEWLHDIETSASFWTSLNAFFGAVLGASFYVLVKTQPYLATRSYDPKYNASYISRFFTGVIGGLILSIALGPFISGKLGTQLDQSLSPGVIALLGGFSARAVELILQRLVEVLMAAVRGDGSEDAKARLAAASAAKDNAVKKSLDAVIDAHLNGAPPAKVKALLDSLRDEVSQPTKF
ncbi:hypothetical protein [Scleromatobacter humisilvae]|uniref:Uncharacterized protein n=1 Tax=Scleromatobacter humisilvae TaxID=2897159 RepID=A0A9X1YIC9_9BURK|nr:hypothetical protein [Scleromatobacter humisilvae]MCK9687039.1 hypothetical protein [Scleromatobacter humisilvae]